MKVAIDFLAAKLVCCLSWLLYPVQYVLTALFQSSLLLIDGMIFDGSHSGSGRKTGGSRDEKTALDADSLFPPTIKFIKNLTALDARTSRSARGGRKNADEEEQRQEAAPATAKQCSTASGSVFLPLTNARGELEFQLGHAAAEGATPLYHSVQQLTPNSDSVSPNSSSGDSVHAHGKAKANPAGVAFKSEFNNLSPVSSIKSNNSQESLNAAANSSDACVKDSLSDEDDCDDLEDDVPDSEKIHQCPHCDSKFRIRGYLTRHMKKHSKTKAYHCPFYDDSTESRCHQTGGFSRRDTFKTHLKARHFRYPPGVKSNKRTGMMGWCGICGEKFLNNEIWVERHIEMGLCPGLTDDYIKTLKIGKKKTGKHSKFLDVDNHENIYNNNNNNSSSSNILNHNSQNNHYLLHQHLHTRNASPENIYGSTTASAIATNAALPSNSNAGFYMQSPSSVNSSPSPFLSNPSLHKQATLANLQPTSHPLFNSISDTENHHTDSTADDLETLELLLKQQELTRIISSLKQKQEEAQNMQQLQSLQQLQQFQQQQSIQQLQQLQQLQQQQMHVQHVQAPATSNTDSSPASIVSPATPMRLSQYSQGQPAESAYSSNANANANITTNQLQHFLLQQLQLQQLDLPVPKDEYEDEYPSLDGEFSNPSDLIRAGGNL